MMHQPARIWLLHSLAFLAGLAVALGALALSSVIFADDSDDWVAALGKILVLITISGPVGALAYAVALQRLLGLHIGPWAWLGYACAGLLAVIGWIALAAWNLATPAQSAAILGVALFLAGGWIALRQTRRAVA